MQNIPFFYLQILSGTLELAFRKCFCPDLVSAECVRGTRCAGSNIVDRRSKSLFCLAKQFKGENGLHQSIIKIDKVNTELNSFDDAGRIILGVRKYFNVILHKNKIFVLGGLVDSEYLKSVRAIDSPLNSKIPFNLISCQ